MLYMLYKYFHLILVLRMRVGFDLIFYGLWRRVICTKNKTFSILTNTEIHIYSCNKSQVIPENFSVTSAGFCWLAI